VTAFSYRDGALHAEEMPLAALAEAVGTPAYVYSEAALTGAYRRLQAAFATAGLDPLICYAVKANSNQAVIAHFAGLGAGADVVSEGELRRALAAGVAAEKIVFAGVGKTAAEMRVGLEAGIFQFNAESLPELKLLAEVAAGMGLTAPVTLRINPDVDAKTHAKISTGKKENKFGIAFETLPAVLALIAESPGLALKGLAVHIGSQLTDLAPYRAAFESLAGLYSTLKREGWGVERIDLGGGLGIPYRDEIPPTPEDYARLIAETVGGLDAELACEPGRHLVGTAGILLGRTIYVKEGSAKRFVILDAAMNDLLRPTLYEAWHGILPVQEPGAEAHYSPADVVGPVCESGDFFAFDRSLPEIAAGDLIAVTHAGAYGAVMASSYNSRLLVPEVLVSGARHCVIRPRPDYATLIQQDRLPDWSPQSRLSLAAG